MSLSITHNGNTYNPYLVLGYEWQRPSNNIVHAIIGSTNPTVTFRPAGPRTGTLSIFCLTEGDAVAMANLHADIGAFDFVDTDVTSASMTYVPVGLIGVALDEATLVRWIVTVPFQEVAL